MSHILTLVASSQDKPVQEEHFNMLAPILRKHDLRYSAPSIWLDEEKALERPVSGPVTSSLIVSLRDAFQDERIDFFITENKNRRKKLLLADMDSTIATSETLDELAEHAGIKDKIAAITARAMEGELDFHDALRERVGLLAGLPIAALSETLNKTVLSPGAKTLVQTMREHGATCVLVSGGFTFFTENIGQKCGFHFNHGNVLDIQDDALTGQVILPILDKSAKVDFLNHYMDTLGLETDDCVTIGDGANDLPMLKTAGLGVGYHPKNTVKDEINNCILYGDLTALLYAQGYTSDDIQGMCS